MKRKNSNNTAERQPKSRKSVSVDSEKYCCGKSGRINDEQEQENTTTYNRIKMFRLFSSYENSVCSVHNFSLFDEL